MTKAGYSGTPLAKKLGLKNGQSVAFCGLPDSLKDLPCEREFSTVELCDDWTGTDGNAHERIHLFTKSAAAVDAATPMLRDQIKPDGMIWMSWPKKASKVPTDVTEDVIRARALADVLVDVKVCAVDDIWSGLKLVARKENRASHINASVKG